MCRTKMQCVSCVMCGVHVEQTQGKGRARLYCESCRAVRAKAAYSSHGKVVTCVECQTQWMSKVTAGRHHVYCSAECRRSAEARRRVKEVKCMRCNSKFVSKTGKGRLCPKCHHWKPSFGRLIACEQCGTHCYSPQSRDRRFCSVDCRIVFIKTATTRRQAACKSEMEVLGIRKPFDTGSKCVRCGGSVVRTMYWSEKGQCWRSPTVGKGDKRLYCGKSCAMQHRWDKNQDPVRLMKHIVRVIEGVMANLISDVLNGLPSCCVCGAGLKKRWRKTCSDECRLERGRQMTRDAYERRTGVRLSPVSSGRSCKHCRCDIQADNRNGRGRSSCDQCNLHRGDFKSRAMLYGVRYTNVSRRVVFERDGWRCQLCGHAVLRKAKRHKVTRRLHPRTASLDHIIPMVKGGDHVERNCQCACLSCNVRKHARRIGQTRLF